MLPREGFVLAKHILVLILKRGAEEQDDSVAERLQNRKKDWDLVSSDCSAKYVLCDF